MNIANVCPTIFLLCLSVSIHAQDRERFEPKTPGEEAIVETPKTVPVRDPEPPVAGSDEVVFPEIKGLVLLSEPAQVSDRFVRAEGIQVHGDPVMRDPGLLESLRKFLGQPGTLARINQIARELTRFYIEQGRPLVDVLVPEQDVSFGTVQFVVIEARLGQVLIEGNQHFSGDYIRRQVRLEAGDRVVVGPLIEDIDWLARNPFLDVSPVLQPGEAENTTDLLLRIQDRRKWSVYAGYEDSGNALTGDDRYLAGFNHGDVWGLGHQVNVQAMVAEDVEELTAFSASYVAPLPWRHLLLLYGSQTDSNVGSGDVDVEGFSLDIGLRYSAGLPALSFYQHELYGGVDYREAQNTLDVGFITASDTITALLQGVLGYRGTQRDRWGQTSFDLSGTLAPGGLVGHGDDADFDEVRAGATADYVYTRLNISRITRLPANMMLRHELRTQWTDDRLLSSEQLSVGGYASVRGHDEREMNQTDEGFLLRNELFLTTLTLPGENLLQGLIFLDYARVSAQDDNVIRADGSGVSTGEMLAIGPGVRWSLGEVLSLRADYGFQLIDSGSLLDQGRAHLGLTIRY